jgi:hypothetical protein
MADLRSFLNNLGIGNYYDVLGFNGVHSVSELSSLNRADMQVCIVFEKA